MTFNPSSQLPLFLRNSPRVISVNHRFALLLEYWFNSNHAVVVNVDYKFNDDFKNEEAYRFNQNTWLNFRTDYMYALSEIFKITTGFSRRYGLLPRDLDKGIDFDQAPVLYGIGNTITWVRPKMLFSSPSIGFHHYVEKDITHVMLGTGFY